jgi:hypothetical protein
VPGEILIAPIAKLPRYGFEGAEGRFAEFPRLLEKQAATALARSARSFLVKNVDTRKISGLSCFP